MLNGNGDQTNNVPSNFSVVNSCIHQFLHIMTSTNLLLYKSTPASPLLVLALCKMANRLVSPAKLFRNHKPIALRKLRKKLMLFCLVVQGFTNTSLANLLLLNLIINLLKQSSRN